MQCPYCKEEIMDGAVKCKHCGTNLAATGAAAIPSDDFGLLFSSATGIWKGNLTDLLLLTLVFILVVWIPVANIGFISGYTRSVLKVARGEGRAEIGDIFNAWDCFGNLFVYMLLCLIGSVILNLIPIVGSLASICLGFLVAPGIYAIIDNRRGAIDAFKWGIESIQANFVPWLIAYLVGSVLAFAGFLLLVIGALFTMPLGQLILVLQYDRVKPS